MLFLNAADVERALPMADLIDTMKDAFSSLSAGKAAVPLRTQVPVEERDAVSLFMPAYLKGESSAMAMKAVSVFPENPGQGLPTIHAVVLVINDHTGAVEALLEGSRLTALRTGAASGAATDVLANPNPTVGAIFGAGTQAHTQLQAICTVRNLETVYIFDPQKDRVERMMAKLHGKGPIPEDLRRAKSPREAVGEADLICTATTSKTPVFSDSDLKSGVHINGVGSYTPEMVEVPPQVAGRAAVFAGSREGVLAEAGEILAAMERGLIRRDQITELGDVINRNAQGRTEVDQWTFFKSVGVAVQDAAAARLALDRARRQGLGKELTL